MDHSEDWNQHSQPARQKGMHEKTENEACEPFLLFGALLKKQFPPSALWDCGG